MGDWPEQMRLHLVDWLSMVIVGYELGEARGWVSGYTQRDMSSCVLEGLLLAESLKCTRPHQKTGRTVGAELTSPSFKL
jgi:hypothetical protein